MLWRANTDRRVSGPGGVDPEPDIPPDAHGNCTAILSSTVEPSAISLLASSSCVSAHGRSRPAAVQCCRAEQRAGQAKPRRSPLTRPLTPVQIVPHAEMLGANELLQFETFSTRFMTCRTPLSLTLSLCETTAVILSLTDTTTAPLSLIASGRLCSAPCSRQGNTRERPFQPGGREAVRPNARGLPLIQRQLVPGPGIGTHVERWVCRAVASHAEAQPPSVPCFDTHLTCRHIPP